MKKALLTLLFLLLITGTSFAQTKMKVGTVQNDGMLPAPTITSPAASATGISGGNVSATPYLDGVAGSVLSLTSAVSGSLGLTIGRYSGGSYNGDYFQGAIAEIIITTSSLSDTDRQKIEGYLACKYGLQANLPGGHTYETACP